FMIGGPQSAYANTPVVIEEVVGWVKRALGYMDAQGYDRMQPKIAASQWWTSLVEDIFNSTLLPGGKAVSSWYLGGNVEGKPSKVLFYFGGASGYFDELEKDANKNFHGFSFSPAVEEVNL